MLFLKHDKQVPLRSLWTSSSLSAKLFPQTADDLLPHLLRISPYQWALSDTKDFIINSVKCNNCIVDYAKNVLICHNCVPYG